MRLCADVIVRNIGQLLTMCQGAGSGKTDRLGGEAPGRPDEEALGLVPRATVAVAGGKIIAAGPEAEIEPRLAKTDGTLTLDAAGGVVTPGLIDPHTHLLFAGWREAEFAQRLEGLSYLDILAAGGGILNTVARFRAATDEQLLAWGRAALDRMLAAGTTTVEAKSGYGLSREQELRALRLYRCLDAEHPVDLVPTFLGAHAVPPGYRDRPDAAGAYVDEVCVPMLDEIAAEGLARFCDVFCEEGVFGIAESRRLLLAAKERGLGAKLHADEIEPMGGAELAAEVGAVSADHLGRVSEEGIRLMARAGVVGVLLPSTIFTLGLRDYAPARRMLEAGLEIALATDYNPGTSPVESLPLVMGIACRTMRLTPAEAFRACTAGAAKAVGLAGKAGQIKEGLPADLVIFEAGDYREIPYRLGAPLVDTVLKNGRVVVSGGHLVTAANEPWR